jgi:hypothetical protein
MTTERFGLRQGLIAVAAGASLALSPVPAHAREGRHTHTAPNEGPSVSKTFDPVTVAPAADSLVTITLTNPNATAAVLTAELDDVLPSSVAIGGGAGSTTCPNGIVSAIAGFPVFALGLGAEIPAQGSCTVTVCVVSDMSGTYTNTIPAGALQTDMGSNAETASAMLTVTDDVIFANRFEGPCSS